MSILILQSCGKSGGKSADILNHIPSNAIMVATVDINQFLSKSNWSAVYKEVGTNLLQKEQNTKIKTLLENPTESGIDTKGSMAVYSAAMAEDFATYIIFPLADVAKFEAAIVQDKSKANKQNYTLVGEDDEDAEGFIAWDKNLAVFVINMDGFTADLDLKLVDLFNKPKSNIQSVANFNKHYTNGKDMASWACFDSLVAQLLNDPATGGQVKMFLPMLSLTEAALYNNIFSGYAQFENGKASWIVDYKFSEELRKKFGGIFNDKLSKDYSNYLVGDNIIATTSLSLNVSEADKIINSYANVPFLGAMLQGVTKSSTYKNITKTFNGDIVTTYQAADKAAIENKAAHFTILVGLKEGADFKALLNELMPSDAPVKKTADNEYSLTNIEGYEQVTLYFNDKVIVLSSNPASIEAAKTGKAANSIDSKTYAQMNTGYFTIWANALGMQAPSIMSQSANLIDRDVQLFENTIEAFSGNMTSTSGTSEWVLIDKSKNSLEVLMREFIKIGIEAEKQNSKYNNSSFYEEEETNFEEVIE